MSTNAYTLAATTHHNLTNRIAEAYRAAGLTPPTRADELRRLLDNEPTPDQLAETLAVESLAVADLEAWTQDALDRVHRAQAVLTLRQAVARHREAAAKRNAPDLVREAAADLAEPFTRAAKKLTPAAKKLPAPDPFDLAATVDTDTTRERRTALEALALFAAVASIHTRRHVADLNAPARDVLMVIDVPEVPRAQVHRLTRSVLNPDDDRDGVRRLLRDAESHGPDRAIVEAARGTYGNRVALALPSSPADLDARWDRATHAVGGTLVNGHEKQVRVLS